MPYEESIHKEMEKKKVQDHKGETSQQEMIIENCYSSTRYLYLILQNLQKSQRNNQTYSEAKENKISCRSFVPTQWVAKKHQNRGAQFIENGASPQRKKTLYEERKEERKKKRKKKWREEQKKKGEKKKHKKWDRNIGDDDG